MSDSAALKSLLMDSLLEWAEPKFCAPDGVTLGQGNAILLKFMEENPDKRHWPAAGLVTFSLMRAFSPLSKSKGGSSHVLP